MSTVTISYDSNEGICSTNQVTAESGSTIVLPYASRLGYTFAGWSTDIDAYEGYTDDYVVGNSSVTLHAIWHLEESSYQLYLGSQRITAAYLGSTEIRFCIPDDAKIENSGYPSNYYLTPRKGSTTEYDIVYVNTWEDVSRWVLSTTAPSNPTEGTVWVELIPNSGDQSLSINSSDSYVIRCHQYLSGAWTIIEDSKICKDGTWIPLSYENNKYYVSTNAQKTHQLDVLHLLYPTKAIPSWTFSESKPASANTGDVWVHSLPMSNGADTIKYSGNYMYPIRAYQYLSGAWSQRDCKYLKSGSFVSPAYEPLKYYVALNSGKSGGLDVLQVTSSMLPTAWSFSATKPTSPTNGMVWIQSLSMSNGADTIQYSNNYMYPIRAYQYVSGSWTSCTCKYLKAGSWTSPAYEDAKYYVALNSGKSNGLDVVQITPATTITSWTVSTTAPARAEGAVWIEVIPCNQQNVNDTILSSGSSTYIVRVNQWYSNKWTQCDCTYLYSGTTWKSPPYQDQQYYVVSNNNRTNKLDALKVTTTTYITSWVFSETEPSNPGYGTVWVKSLPTPGNTCSAATVVYNNTHMYVLRAYQKMSTGWTQRSCQYVYPTTGALTSPTYESVRYYVAWNSSKSSGSDIVWTNVSSASLVYTFSATKPSNPAEGDIWVESLPMTDSSETVKYNNSYMYILRAYQYLSGSWVQKDCKYMVSGSWVVPPYESTKYYVTLNSDRTTGRDVAWADTTNITSWVFSATKPSSPTNGMVWVEGIQSSTKRDDAVVYSSKYWYLLRAYQYVSNQWVKKTLKYLKAGTGSLVAPAYEDIKYYVAFNNNKTSTTSGLDVVQVTTDTAIASWSVGETKPSSPTNGAVWIQTLSTSGTTKINVNDTILPNRYILRAFQYTSSGGWVLKTCQYLYSGTTWKSPPYQDSVNYYVALNNNKSTGLDAFKVDIGDDTVTSWTFSDSKPTSPTNGMVWVKSVALSTNSANDTVLYSSKYMRLVRAYYYNMGYWWQKPLYYHHPTAGVIRPAYETNLNYELIDNGSGGVTVLRLPSGALTASAIGSYSSIIPKWTLSASAPSSPAKGDVWVVTSTTTGKYLTVKSNGTTVAITNCKQYSGSAWTNLKYGSVLVGSEWIDMMSDEIHYPIYWQGYNKATEWTVMSYTDNTSGTATINTNSISMTGFRTICTNTKIAITGYAYVCAEIEIETVPANAQFRIGYSDNSNNALSFLTTSGIVDIATSEAGTTKTIKASLENSSGSYYIKVSSTTAGLKFKVRKVWLSRT